MRRLTSRSRWRQKRSRSCTPRWKASRCRWCDWRSWWSCWRISRTGRRHNARDSSIVSLSWRRACGTRRRTAIGTSPASTTRVNPIKRTSSTSTCRALFLASRSKRRFKSPRRRYILLIRACGRDQGSRGICTVAFHSRRAWNRCRARPAPRIVANPRDSTLTTRVMLPPTRKISFASDADVRFTRHSRVTRSAKSSEIVATPFESLFTVGSRGPRLWKPSVSRRLASASFLNPVRPTRTIASSESLVLARFAVTGGIVAGSRVIADDSIVVALRSDLFAARSLDDAVRLLARSIMILYMDRSFHVVNNFCGQFVS